jgi:predicted component of type VI protein secretion system
MTMTSNHEMRTLTGAKGVKLRVLHGKLKRRSGKDAGDDVTVHGKRFVIGSGPDCQMRCPIASISPHHCEIVQQQNSYLVRDLSSDSGTFVNGEPLKDQRVLANGDHLRLGRLEFEVVLDKPVPVPPPPPPRPADSVGDRISEMLTEADQEDQAQRFEDPGKRKFVRSAPIASEAPAAPEKKKPSPPPKRPPMKLPPAPKLVADNTVDAAEEVLKKFFEKPKK